MLTICDFNRAQLTNRFPFTIGNIRWNWHPHCYFNDNLL